MDPNFETLTWAVDDGVLTLTLNRPYQLNAFNLTMAAELEQAFRQVRRDIKRNPPVIDDPSGEFSQPPLHCMDRN